jgi:hypothetical protein
LNGTDILLGINYRANLIILEIAMQFNALREFVKRRKTLAHTLTAKYGRLDRGFGIQSSPVDLKRFSDETPARAHVIR